MDIPSSRRKALAAGQRRQAVHKHILGGLAGRHLTKGLSKAGLGLLLDGNELLLARLADELDLGGSSAADGEELGELGLVDDAELGVVASRVSLPVGVVGDVARGQRHGVVVLERRVGAGGRVTEVRVERDTVGSFGVNGEESSENLPHARRLDGLLL